MEVSERATRELKFNTFRKTRTKKLRKLRRGNIRKSPSFRKTTTPFWI